MSCSKLESALLAKYECLKKKQSINGCKMFLKRGGGVRNLQHLNRYLQQKKQT